ncbi:MAG: adenine phosphoribosyltransferase [Lentisphaerae bacterium]|jgi:adenine phosphoribosyltransferase|nr:adenine phosphoribosyltransferase [Lentisphaerota bacterium]
MNADQIKQAIRAIPNFPLEGVIFRDITTVLQDSNLFNSAVSLIADRYPKGSIDKVAAVEARGFIFGAAVARELGVGFVPIRKKGKLPYKTIEASYDLEYGSATLEIHLDAISKGENILVVDDLLATGGTAAAAATLIDQLGGQIKEFAFLIELCAFKGRDKIIRYPIFSTMCYE